MKQIMNIYKPVGLTPQQLIDKFKQKYKQYKNIPVSHAGKLDPLASGVMIFITGDETKNLKGIVELPWCGTEDCAIEIENILEGNTLGEPIENNECNESCPVCSKPGTTWMRYAKSY